MSGLDKVSVVMPVRDAALTIGEQLASLAAQTYAGDWELVVADNGSADATVALVEEWRAKILVLTVVDAGQRPGVGHARNVGAAAATGSLILFCDADDVVDPGWVAAMATGLGEHAAVGGRLGRQTLNDEVALAARPGGAAGLHEGFGFLPYPLSANCGVRREVWTRVGGFDAAYPSGSEDVVFFWRAQLAGFDLGYVPAAVVRYRLRSGLRAMTRQYYTYGATHPRLFRDFARHGMPRTAAGTVVGEWAWLAAHLPWVAGTPRHRAIWLTRATMRTGRLVGSVRHRIVYL